MTLPDVLREARRRSAMSLRDVERATGIRSGHLSQIETGNIARPEVALLWDLASLYELDFEELLRLAGHELAAGTTLTVAFRALTGLSPDEQLEAIRFMAKLKQG
jgi:transcriptional regulator with XRE-family HTH domain